MGSVVRMPTALLTLALALPQGGPGAAPPIDVPSADPAVWVTAGARIPDLELPRVDGAGSVDLADLRGRKLLLIQFAAW